MNSMTNKMHVKTRRLEKEIHNLKYIGNTQAIVVHKVANVDVRESCDKKVISEVDHKDCTFKVLEEICVYMVNILLQKCIQFFWKPFPNSIGVVLNCIIISIRYSSSFS